MKFLLLFIVLATSVNAQSLYNSKANTEVSYRDTEAFTVTFKKSVYGLEFQRNDKVLNQELKTKIERFMKETKRPKFKGVGTFTLDIIKRNNTYYIVESKQPERLLKL